MKVWANRLLILVLFAGLVVVLLKFQGIILREDHPTTTIQTAVPIGPTDQTARVERKVLPRVQVYPGFVEAIDPVQIAPRVMAAVFSVVGREGDAVTQGDVVATLDDRDALAKLAQVQAALDAAQARALQAQLAFDRAQRLHDAEALTTGEWESARAGRDGTQAQAEQALSGLEQAKTALTWFKLTAPFDGRVLERHAEPGDLATPGRAILTLYRENRLRFRVSVPEERAAELTVGGRLETTFDRLAPRQTKLTRILPAADPRTGTVTLHLALEPSEDLRPGLLGRLRLTVGEREALVVPAAAVEHIGQVERVRLVRDGLVVPVTVRTGKQWAGLVEVLSGLAEGEEVVLP